MGNLATMDFLYLEQVRTFGEITILFKRQALVKVILYSYLILKKMNERITDN